MTSPRPFCPMLTACVALVVAGPASAGNIAAPAMTVTPIYMGTTNMLGMIGTARQSTADATQRGLIGDRSGTSQATPPTAAYGSTRAAAPTAADDLHVANDPAVTAEVRKTYLATLAQGSGQAIADQADHALGNVRSTFANMTAPFGLRGDDFGDVMTTYTAVVWMAANRRSDLPSVAEIQGLRGQVRGVIAGKLTDPRQRQLLAETMMYQSCMLVLLREQAKGDPAVLDTIAQSIDKSAPQQGEQMRQLALTDQGLVQR